MKCPKKFEKRMLILTCDKEKFNRLVLKWRKCFLAVKKCLEDSEKRCKSEPVRPHHKRGR